jgi:hypothetical protein
MKLHIEDKIFDTREITQLYPAVLVKTGYGNETTRMSMTWFDTEGEGKVEVAGYGIFVHLKDDAQHAFVFKTREEMDMLAAEIAKQLRGE